MNTKVNNAYFLIPVFYLMVIIFLLYMQFSGSSSFNAEVAEITITGERQAGPPGKSDIISELSVLLNGLEFSFGEENPALVFSQDGLTHNLMAEDYRVTGTGIDVKLSKGISVSFYRTQSDSENLHVGVSMEDPDSIKYIYLPIESADSQFISSAGVPVLTIQSESRGSFFLTMPEGGYFNEESSSLVILPGNGGASEIVLERTAGSGLEAFRYWRNGGAELISEAECDRLIEQYIADAADSLLGSRYNPSRGTWTMGDGSSGFDENALIMAATETIGTSAYRAALSQLDRAAASHSRDLSIKSAPLFGNIVNEGWAYDQGLQNKTPQLTESAREGDYSIFSDEDLTAVVLTEDSDDLIRALSSMTDEAAGSGLSLDEALAVLSFYTGIVDIYPEISSQFYGATELVESVILPAVRVLGGRIYISEDGESVDIEQTLLSGVLLNKPLLSGNEEDVTAVGRELIRSALLLAENTGILPGTVHFSGETETSREGILTPETVYPALSGNPYYPAADYFFDETGEKISVINQAENFKVEKTDYGYRMSFDFPPGQAHAFAVRNFQPFYRMNLLGYVWNSDHRFLTYSSGWWYDRQNNTLFMKVTHRMRTEEILIYSEAPPAPPAPVEETTEESVSAPEGSPES